MKTTDKYLVKWLNEVPFTLVKKATLIDENTLYVVFSKNCVNNGNQFSRLLDSIFEHNFNVLGNINNSGLTIFTK